MVAPGAAALGPPTTETTLVVLLGASEYPQKPSWTNPVLRTSASAIRDYLVSPQGFALKGAQMLDLFDSDANQVGQLLQVEKFLAAAGANARDLIVYYVGHGGFDNREYYLGIRSTQNNREDITAIESRKLAKIVREGFRRKRLYVIMDACFAASALTDWQGDEIAAAVRNLEQHLPLHGTAFLAAASRYDVTLAPRAERYTVFTGALLAALSRGVTHAGPRLSMYELYDEIRDLLRQRDADDDGRPELHVPGQRDGDVSRIPVFPNIAHARALERAQEAAALETAKRQGAAREAEARHAAARDTTEVHTADGRPVVGDAVLLATPAGLEAARGIDAARQDIGVRIRDLDARLPARRAPPEVERRGPRRMVMVVVAVFAAVVVTAIVVSRGDQDARTGPTGAANTATPPVPPATAPPPAATIALETPPHDDIKAPRAGFVEVILSDRAVVKEADVVCKLVGDKPIEADLAMLSRDQKHLQDLLDIATKKRDAAHAAGNKAAEAAAQVDVAARGNQLATQQGQLAAKTSQLDEFLIHSPGEGIFMPTAMPGQKVSAGGVVARLQRYARPVATFHVTDIKPFSAGAGAQLAVAKRGVRVDCIVTEVQAATVKVTCPADPELTDGTEVALIEVHGESAAGPPSNSAGKAQPATGREPNVTDLPAPRSGKGGTTGGRRPYGRITTADKHALDESTLSADVVMAKIQSAYMAGVKRCYNDSLFKDASAHGKVTLSWTVNETGRSAKGVAHGFNAEIDDCISGLMAGWRFPIPKDKDGEATEASFVFALQLAAE